MIYRDVIIIYCCMFGEAWPPMSVPDLAHDDDDDDDDDDDCCIIIATFSFVRWQNKSVQINFFTEFVGKASPTLSAREPKTI